MVSAAQPVDSSILHEIVRIIEARRRVPGRVAVRLREYQITYLEDHQRRLEEALQRHDADRLNMLYGQLASKVKYQMLRRLPEGAREKKRTTAGKKPAGARKRQTAKVRTPARKRGAPGKRAQPVAKRTVTKSRAPTKKRRTPTKKRRAPAKKRRAPAKKRHAPAKKRRAPTKKRHARK